MERILVGVDGSTNALGALGWAADLAGRVGAELVAARVFTSPQMELPPGRDAELRREEQAELDGWCEQRAAAAGRRRSTLVDGDPPDALLATATREGADLLVVGGRGSGGFGDLHLGSVAHHLTHHTTMPLAVVPPSGTAPVTHLVVGVDGSPGSLAAARFCADLAGGLGVGATAVYAAEPSIAQLPDEDPRSRHHAEFQARGWAAPIEDAGVALELDVEGERHPVDVLARALEAHPGSAAVVGTRGLGGFEGLRLGRVPLQLVHHTGAATVLVPASAAH